MRFWNPSLRHGWFYAIKLQQLHLIFYACGGRIFDRMNNYSAQDWISRLQLLPHPEGGFYREVFRSASPVRPFSQDSVRAACTSIYYLLEGGDYSGFHRLDADEIWYFHAGVPLHIHSIGTGGEIQTRELSFAHAGTLSLAIPAHTWFAAEIPDKKGFALCSCAVAPGFEFSKFQMGKKDRLIAEYPAAAMLIQRLSR